MSCEHPCPLARSPRSTTSPGSGGVVTSALRSAAVNPGSPQQVSHDERYDVADGFLDVVYNLWEGSWEDGAVLRDRRAGAFTDPAEVHAIAHRGRYLTVPGIALTEPSPQRTPVLLQAGVPRTRGRDVAARHAEVLFVDDDRAEQTRRFVDDVRTRARAAGRRRPGSLSMVTAVTQDVVDGEVAAGRVLVALLRYLLPDGASSSAALVGHRAGRSSWESCPVLTWSTPSRGASPSSERGLPLSLVAGAEDGSGAPAVSPPAFDPAVGGGWQGAPHVLPGFRRHLDAPTEQSPRTQGVVRWRTPAH